MKDFIRILQVAIFCFALFALGDLQVAIMVLLIGISNELVGIRDCLDARK